MKMVEVTVTHMTCEVKVPATGELIPFESMVLAIGKEHTFVWNRDLPSGPVTKVWNDRVLLGTDDKIHSNPNAENIALYRQWQLGPEEVDRIFGDGSHRQHEVLLAAAAKQRFIEL